MELRCKDDLQDETEVGIATEQNVPRFNICAVWSPFGLDIGFRGEKAGVGIGFATAGSHSYFFTNIHRIFL